MSALPIIPPTVRTLEQLDAWIEGAAPRCDESPNAGERQAARMRLAVAVMDRAGEIGARQRSVGAPT